MTNRAKRYMEQKRAKPVYWVDEMTIIKPEQWKHIFDRTINAKTFRNICEGDWSEDSDTQIPTTP